MVPVFRRLHHSARTRPRIRKPSLASTALLSLTGLLHNQTFAFSSPKHFENSPKSESARVTSTTVHTQQRIMKIEPELQDGSWSDILPFEKGSHNSARISIPPTAEGEDDHFSPEMFERRLEATISTCKELGKSSIWVEVPMQRSSLIEIGNMYDLGFRFHHALEDRSMLNNWLREDESKVPEFSTHNVGVGAVVLNSRDEILCVRELRKNYMPWKTPTGLSELGEHIDEAAEREVLEETGIHTTFNSVIGFRQTHGLAHGRSDLFFVCLLDPIEEQDEDGRAIIPEPVAQESEIEKVQWIPLSEYREMVDGSNGQLGHPMMAHIINALDAGRRIERKVVTSVVPGRSPNAIYYPVVDSLLNKEA